MCASTKMEIAVALFFLSKTNFSFSLMFHFLPYLCKAEMSFFGYTLYKISLKRNQ